MNQQVQIKPFISIVIIVVSMFFLVFIKMEVRRLSYSVLHWSLKEKLLKDKYRYKTVELAQIMRTERIKNYAEVHLALNEPQKGQIIHFTGNRIAIKQ
ncbi:MAG: hypothetical protein SGJ18_16215 [Pseudomonadota bacterium]|nr:hypothetical protein [Pseudomonadota bacterium]